MDALVQSGIAVHRRGVSRDLLGLHVEFIKDILFLGVIDLAPVGAAPVVVRRQLLVGHRVERSGVSGGESDLTAALEPVLPQAADDLLF